MRFLLSAHASLEELFLFGRLGSAFGMPEDGVAISWRVREKPQPPTTKFKIPPVDAPNVRGARDMGFPVRSAANGAPDLTAFRQQVEQGRVSALYVFDPGPGRVDRRRLVDHQRAKSGKLPLLIVQGVLLTRAGPRGRHRPARGLVDGEGRALRQPAGTCRAPRARLNPPGDAQEDWQVLVNLASRWA